MEKKLVWVCLTGDVDKLFYSKHQIEEKYLKKDILKGEGMSLDNFIIKTLNMNHATPIHLNTGKMFAYVIYDTKDYQYVFYEQDNNADEKDIETFKNFLLNCQFDVKQLKTLPVEEIVLNDVDLDKTTYAILDEQFYVAT